ncbi:hypothetical protein EYC80_000849 [Monilinia laxa]|uniref:Uncharacterized protein n=1 Tax=Monilinia laxa TaxID=61186 RepID=A0A5N6K878_MONLA|nr:hypothetical protein EYC80_000849 [Monilinia laxa]
MAGNDCYRRKSGLYLSPEETGIYHFRVKSGQIGKSGNDKRAVMWKCTVAISRGYVWTGKCSRSSGWSVERG